MKRYLSIATTLLVALPILAVVPGCGGSVTPITTPTPTPSPSATGTVSPTGTANPAPTIAPTGPNSATLTVRSTEKAKFGNPSFVATKVTVSGGGRVFSFTCTDSEKREITFITQRNSSEPVHQGEVFANSINNDGELFFTLVRAYGYSYGDALESGGRVTAQSVNGSRVKFQFQNVVVQSPVNAPQESVGTVVINGSVIATIPPEDSTNED